MGQSSNTSPGDCVRHEGGVRDADFWNTPKCTAPRQLQHSQVLPVQLALHETHNEQVPKNCRWQEPVVGKVCTRATDTESCSTHMIAIPSPIRPSSPASDSCARTRASDITSHTNRPPEKSLYIPSSSVARQGCCCKAGALQCKERGALADALLTWRKLVMVRLDSHMVRANFFGGGTCCINRMYRSPTTSALGSGGPFPPRPMSCCTGTGVGAHPAHC